MSKPDNTKPVRSRINPFVAMKNIIAPHKNAESLFNSTKPEMGILNSPLSILNFTRLHQSIATLSNWTLSLPKGQIVTLTLCLITLLSSQALAEGEKYTTKIQHSAIEADRSFAVKDGWFDYMQNNANWETNDFVIAQLEDYISIELNPHHPTPVTGYNDISIALEITAWDKSNTQSTISNVTLTLNPKLQYRK